MQNKDQKKKNERKSYEKSGRDIRAKRKTTEGKERKRSEKTITRNI
jgi:hypothetical protein